MPARARLLQYLPVVEALMLRCRESPEVGRIETGRDMTEMVQFKAIRDRPDEFFVDKPMRPTTTKLPVSPGIERT